MISYASLQCLGAANLLRRQCAYYHVQVCNVLELPTCSEGSVHDIMCKFAMSWSCQLAQKAVCMISCASLQCLGAANLLRRQCGYNMNRLSLFKENIFHEQQSCLRKKWHPTNWSVTFPFDQSFRYWHWTRFHFSFL